MSKFVLAFLSFVLIANPVWAQNGFGQAPDRARFLIVIDDSKSMRATDTDRLAVLAARTFLELLSEDDRVRIVGMNQLARMDVKNASAMSLLSPERAKAWADAYLGENEEEDESKKIDAQALSAYAGNETPCRDALLNAKVVLNGWGAADRDADKSRQVVLFLTDGECESSSRKPSDQSPVPAADWTKDVSSYSKKRIPLANRLLFFPVRFEGNTYDETLNDYGAGTQVPETVIDSMVIAEGRGSERLGSIVKTFASVFSLARGYPLPEDDRSYAKADIVHVLAVRPMSAGEQLKITMIRSPKGQASVGVEQGGIFKPSTVTEFGRKQTDDLYAAKTKRRRHYGPGREFEYQSAKVDPDGEFFRIKVNRDNAYHVVVPDYRGLQSVVAVGEGRCQSHVTMETAWAQKVSGVDLGTEFCVRVGLKSRKGFLEPDQDLPFTGRFRTGHPELVAPFEANQNLTQRVDLFESVIQASDEMKFGKGAHRLQGKVTIGNKDPIDILSAPQELKVVVEGMFPEIVDAGQVFADFSAGDTKSFKVLFKGEFPAGTQFKYFIPESIVEHPCIDSFGLKHGNGPQLDERGRFFELVTVNPGQRRDFLVETSSCRGGARVNETVLYKTSAKGVTLGDSPLEIAFSIEQTPFWEYWGKRIIITLLALFIISWIICFIKGWSKPAQLEEHDLRFYFSYDKKLLFKSNQEIDDTDESAGSRKIIKELKDSRGWYCNPSVAVGGDRVQWEGPSFDIEWLGSRGYRVVLKKRNIALHQVDTNELNNPDEAFTFIDFEPEKRTIDVAGLCNLYAALFGKQPKVRASSEEIKKGDYWYKVQSNAEDVDSEYYFKLDSAPDEGSQE